MISIVMPVHNTGIYLHKSIGSILSQTYGNFELICVDDASNDDLTRRLLQNYEEQDERIRLIVLEKNMGAAEARNIGMKIACGEYMMILDSDDIFDSTMLEKMYHCISENDADLCVCGYRVYSDIQKRIVDVRLPVEEKGITDRVFQLNEMSEDSLLSWTTGAWNKIYKRNFLEENNIYFQTVSSANDVFFSFMCAICADRMVYCQGGIPLFDYRVDNPEQISANHDPLNLFRAISFLFDVQKKRIGKTEHRQLGHALLVWSVDELYKCVDEKKRRELYYFARACIRKHIQDITFDTERLNNILLYFKNKEYESMWFETETSFYVELKEKKDSLFASLSKMSQIIVWGNGMRGKALQRLCRDGGINSIIVTDIKNERTGEKTEYGYQIADTREAEEIAEVIVATNVSIYKYLRDRYGEKYRLINLETI